MKIKVLYEDSDVLVIDKPSGIAVHSDGRTKPARPNGRSGGEKTIADWVLKNYPELKDVGEPQGLERGVIRPGIVHRLDRGTSGVLILAKNQKAHQSLKKQFSAPALRKTGSGLSDRRHKNIKKTYIAVVNGWLKENKGVVNKFIGRSPRDFRRWLAGRGARGEQRPAETHYKILKTFSEKGNKFSILEVSPKTGRTHQIRVHMKYLNHPIVCDSLYNPGGPHPKGFNRMALHAKSIEFKNPKGKVIKVESPLPTIFKKHAPY